MLNRHKAFTLVELLIVIIIIAVLAAIAVPKFTQSSTNSKVAAVRADLKLYRNAIQLFRADTGLYPLNLSMLAKGTGATDVEGHGAVNVSSDYKGPYIEVVDPNDAFGTAWTYTSSTGVLKSGTASPDCTGF